MRHASVITRALAGLALLLGLLAAAAPALADGASVTIHKATCPTGVGPQIFEKCHGNGLGGVGFAIGPDGNESTYVTDGDGVIGPVSVPAGSLHIIENPAVSSQYLGEYVYCRDLTTDKVLFDSDLDGAVGLHGSLPAGANLVCDWYDITPADNGGGTADSGGGTDSSGGGSSASTDASTSASAGSSATTLPVTGVGPQPSGGSSLPALFGLLSVLTLAAWLRKRTA